MKQLGRMVKLFGHDDEGHDEMTDDQDREISGNVIGADMAVLGATGSTVIDLFQVRAEQLAGAATGAAAPEPPAEDRTDGVMALFRLAHGAILSLIRKANEIRALVDYFTGRLSIPAIVTVTTLASQTTMPIFRP